MFRKFVILALVSTVAYTATLNLITDGKYLSASFHGVIVADNQITAKNYDDAIAELDDILKSKLEKNISLQIDGETYNYKVKDLGVEFDTYKTAEKIYKANKKFGLLKRIFKVEVEPVVNFDSDKLYVSLQENVKGLSGAKDARILGRKGSFYVTDHEVGKNIDEELILKSVVASVVSDGPTNIEVSVNTIEPTYTKDEALKDVELMNKLYARTLSLIYGDNVSSSSIGVELNENWVKIRDGQYVFDDELITAFIKNEIASNFDIVKQDAIIRQLPAVENRKAVVEGFAQPGRHIDIEASLKVIQEAIKAGSQSVNLVFITEEPSIINETGVDLGDMKLLAVGRSNFAGSAWGRINNIKYGLEEKFNNVLISPNGVFSAIDNSGREISTRTGWSVAKVIVGGKIVDGVGGGLCQTSTTIYRAALSAGMDILFRQQHSVYVHYYTDYGDGLDAAIFNSEGLDFKFQNNTPSYVLMQSKVIGNDAYVYFYGTDDGRNVELIGPYYGQHNANPHRLLTNLRYNQIGWVRRITYSDGKIVEEPIVSSYKGMPRK